MGWDNTMRVVGDLTPDLTPSPSPTGAGSQNQRRVWLPNRHSARHAAPRPVGEEGGGEVRTFILPDSSSLVKPHKGETFWLRGVN